MRLFRPAQYWLRSRAPGLIGAYKLLMLDADGVLFDTKLTAAHAIMETVSNANNRSMRLSVAEKMAHNVLGGGLSVPEVMKVLFAHEAENDEYIAGKVAEFDAAYAMLDEEHTRLFPDVERTLRELQSENKHLIIVSKKKQSQLETTVRNFGLTGCFEYLFGLRDNQEHKPKPRLFDETIRPLYSELELAEIIMVGDSPETDGMFAKNCGVDFCFTSYGFGRLSDRVDCPVDYVVRNFSQLPECLDKGIVYSP